MGDEIYLVDLLNITARPFPGFRRETDDEHKQRSSYVMPCSFKKSAVNKLVTDGAPPTERDFVNENLL